MLFQFCLKSDYGPETMFQHEIDPPSDANVGMVLESLMRNLWADKLINSTITIRNEDSPEFVLAKTDGK